AGAEGLGEMARIDEKGGLADARAAQRGEQAGRARLHGHEAAGASRNIIEAEGDPLLRVRRRGGKREQRQEGSEKRVPHQWAAGGQAARKALPTSTRSRTRLRALAAAGRLSWIAITLGKSWPVRTSSSCGCG